MPPRYAIASRDCARRAQRSHLGCRVTGRLQQHVGVLPHGGRVAADAEAPTVHREREQHRLHRLTRACVVGQLDIGETAGGLEVRVVEQVFGFGNRRERDPAIYLLRVPARTFPQMID